VLIDGVAQRAHSSTAAHPLQPNRKSLERLVCNVSGRVTMPAEFNGEAMKISERAAQFWPVLVLAARNRQILTYEIMGKATGMATFGQSGILSLIVAYCESRKFPKLTTILVGEDGLPADKIDDPGTLCIKQEEVFAFDWLGQKAPSPDDFK